MATTRKPAAKRKPAARRDASSDGRRRRVTASKLPGKRTLSIGAALVGVGAAVSGVFAWLRLRADPEGHDAPDLTGDRHPDGSERAPAAFRPDIDAPMTAAEREALRPPEGIPTLVNGARPG